MFSDWVKITIILLSEGLRGSLDGSEVKKDCECKLGSQFSI